MNNLEKRIEKLETRTGIGERERIPLFIISGGLNKEQVDAKVKAAIEEYLAAHPECAREDIRIYIVPDAETKQGVLHLLAGARPGELLDASSNGDSL